MLKEQSWKKYTYCSYRTIVGKGEGHITGTVRKKLMDYLEENGISVYRFAKDSGIP